jgi:hypothetical protein
MVCLFCFGRKVRCHTVLGLGAEKLVRICRFTLAERGKNSLQTERLRGLIESNWRGG